MRMSYWVRLSSVLTLLLSCSAFAHEELSHHWAVREYRAELRYQTIWIVIGFLLMGIWATIKWIRRSYR